MALTSYMVKYVDKPDSFISMARAANTRLFHVIQQVNNLHRQTQQEHYTRIHADLLYQWELETENDNRYRTTARYMLLAQYMHMLQAPLISKQEHQWPVSELISRLLSDDGYLAKLVTTYLINFLNTRFYANIPGEIRYLAKYLPVSSRDPNMRNLHRNIKKLSYLLCRVPGCRVTISDITAMYNYFIFAGAELSQEELLSEQQFTRLQNYVHKQKMHTYTSGDMPSSEMEYDLETNHIPMYDNDNDYFDYMPATANDSEEEEDVIIHTQTAKETPHYVAPDTLEPELDLIIEEPDFPMDSVPVIDEDDDFTVIKKGKKGKR